MTFSRVCQKSGKAEYKGQQTLFLGGTCSGNTRGKPWDLTPPCPSDLCRMTLSRVGFLTLAPGRPKYGKKKVSQVSHRWTGKQCNITRHAQSCSTLCNPMNCSPPGSSVHGILQAKLLEWVAISSSKGFSWPRYWTHVSCISCTAGEFFTAEPWGKPTT